MGETSINLRHTLTRLLHYKEKYAAAQERIQSEEKEIKDLKLNLQHKEGELIESQQQLTTFDQELTELRTDLQQKEGELNETQQQLTTLHQELNKKTGGEQSKLTPRFGKETSTDNLTKEIKKLKEQNEKLKDSKFRLGQEKETLDTKLNQLQKDFKKYEKTKQHTEEKENEIKEKNKEILVQTEQINKLKERVESLEKTLIEKEEDLDDVQSENRLLQQCTTEALEEAQTLVKTKEDELEEANTEAKKLKDRLRQDEEKHSKKVADMERKLKTGTAALHTATQEAEKSQDLLKKLEARHEQLQGSVSRLQDELTKAKAETEKVKHELHDEEEEHGKKVADKERQLLSATAALHKVNQEAQKSHDYTKELEAKHEKQLKDMENQLQQMKKMISAVTNFMALQNEDDTKDGTAAIVIAKQMKPLIYMSEPAQQECGLNAIYNFINKKSREKIKQIDGLVPRVKELTDSENEYVKAAAKRTMMKIESDKVYPQHGRGLDIKCEYFKQCQSFIKTLNITDTAWDPMYNMCYCSTCNAKRGHRLYFIRGDPPKDYGIPVGWCRFALKVNEAKADMHKIWDKWHVAFHGTTNEVISKVIEVGYLVVPGDTVLGGNKIGVRPTHIPESESTRKIFLSPTIRYAGMDTYASPSVFTDSGKTFHAKVAFQVRISPKSYEMRRETVRATSQIDPAYLNEELEWVTNERGSTELYGILVKLSPKIKR